MDGKHNQDEHKNRYAYLKLGLATLGSLALLNGLAYAGFEADMKSYTETLLGNPFHYAMATVFGYKALPYAKENQWGGVGGMAALCIVVDVIALKIWEGGLARWLVGTTAS